ncbi:MAG: anti-sigma-factor antagonist [Flavipsychrobacter sp.]|jgi:anti-anti-sigma regulatory factor|nr:anti-sigma-factor antagonist [Flavipsychrobacter sp.]
MEFKIDTKDTFTIIVPINDRLDAKLTGELKNKCAELAQNGVNNYIIDFKNCAETDSSAIDGLVDLHEDCYANERSLVYTELNKQGVTVLKENEADLLINLAPTMKEAIDIISMEILERDLFNEE